ncbi:MAG: hypothetical protein U1E65_23110 [Myxococcota bacterium]
MRALLLLSLLCAGCIDFGYAVDASVGPEDAMGFADAAPGPDAGPMADAAPGMDAFLPDTGNGCVEGPVSLTTPGTEIRIISFALNHPSATIPAGGVVIWRNSDSMPHQLVAGVPGSPISPANGGFDSRELAPGQGYAHRFCRARRLVYYCSTHPSLMNGYRLDIQ